MVIINFEDNKLKMKLNTKSSSLFQKEVRFFKLSKFRYSSTTNEWIAPWIKHDAIVEYLEDIDEIEDNFTSAQLETLVSGEPQQYREKVRRIPDFSLLNYPPMVGKHPNEDFQRNAIRTVINRSRYFLGWGMGSGKSYVTSAVIAHRYLKYRDCSKVLLLTSSIGVDNLKFELIKFIKNISPSKIKTVDKTNRLAFEKNEEADIVIMSYNTFRLVCNAYRDKLKIKAKTPKKPFLPIREWCDGGEAMLILDESHEIAQPTSQRGAMMALHSQLFKYRYLFSGTPADKPEKMYNQFKILDPWLIYNLSFTEWKTKMANVGNHFSQYAINEWKEEELRKQNQRFVASHGEYRESSELVDLPPNIFKKIYLEMSPKHLEVYQRVANARLEYCSSDSKLLRQVPFVENIFPYVSVAIDNPMLLEKHLDKFDTPLKKKISDFNYKYLEKYEELDKILETHEKEKIIFWCVHPSTIEYLGKKYSKLNPICIDGSTSQEERFSLVEKFKKEEEHQLLIANITCLNTSVTMTECKVQVYVERNYNYTEYVQSTERIHRISQNSKVLTYILIYNNSLDVLLDKNLDNKGTLVGNLLNKQFLTHDQWVKVFNASANEKLYFIGE